VYTQPYVPQYIIQCCNNNTNEAVCELNLTLHATQFNSTDMYSCGIHALLTQFQSSNFNIQERWGAQSDALQLEVAALPLQMLLAAGFATYLARASETVRSSMVKRWCACSGILASSSTSSSAQVRQHYSSIQCT
jgi:hypothetical protein